MADLEKMAFKRDRAYLVRLVLMITIALAGGLYIAMHLTSDRSKRWVSDAVFGATVKQVARDGGVAEEHDGEQ